MLNLKKYFPTQQEIKEMKYLHFFGDLLFEPNLWHFNRNSLSYAFLIGGFFCFMPMPFQTIPCVLVALWIRCNLPVSIAVVWISNPITIGPMIYFSIIVGQEVLGGGSLLVPLDLNLSWIKNQIAVIWKPLLVGSLVCGISAGTAGFLGVRAYYRLKIMNYKRRKTSS